jgi:murein endopeptidase
LKQRYNDNLENQVNNLSLQNGGQLGRQRSHQNGLDIDVSYPHINNATNGFDNFAGNLNSARVVAAFDQARLLIYTDRVQMLFTDDRIRRRFCTYLRDNNKLTSHRSIVERFMRHWDGHHNHYHVRVKCTLQNEGCVPDNDYPNTNYCRN